MNIKYRMSKEKDYEDIKKLLDTCFGDRTAFGVLEHLDDRYLLAFDNKKLIGMTGISTSKNLNGYEIDWTCVLPEYRRHGLITDMISQCIKDCTDRVYCSCWRMSNTDRVNLQHAMNSLGFNRVIKYYKSYNSEHNNFCEKCVLYNKQSVCSCYEDLYLKY